MDNQHIRNFDNLLALWSQHKPSGYSVVPVSHYESLEGSKTTRLKCVCISAIANDVLVYVLYSSYKFNRGKTVVTSR